MSNYLFYTLFLLFLCSTSFVVAHNAGIKESGATSVQSVEIFKTDECLKTDKSTGVEKVNKFDNVFFVKTDKMLVALAEAQYTKTENRGEEKYDFVAAYPKKTDDWDSELFKQGGGDDICSNWNTQLATTNTDGNSFSTVKNVVYDAKNKRIYLLVVNKTLADGSQWKYDVVVGSEDISAGKETTPIKWIFKTSENLKTNEFKDQLKKEDFIESSPTHGGGFVTKDGRVIFVLRNTNENSEKAIVFVELKHDEPSNSELNVLHVEKTDKDCYPYVFLWDEKIVMITTNCILNVNKNVKEFSDIEKWEESPGPFYYLSDFFKDKTSFTTAVISDTNVLLFAQKNEGAGGKEQQRENCFTFWFSDGNRTYNAGPAVSLKKEVVSSSIIYAKNKLFFLHQQLDSDKKFYLTRLEEQLKNITATLEKWKSADDAVLNLCKTENSNFKATCVAPLNTEGLVGFLSNTNDGTNNKWKDEYLYVDAEIIESAKLEINNGLKCNGAGQAAKWPVSEGNKNQPYKFTQNGFTLLATVNIHKNNKQLDNSLLGFVLNNDKGRFGLWCTKNNQFGVSETAELTNIISFKKICKPDTTYQIALVFNKLKLTVYVDGEPLNDSVLKTTIDAQQNIKHFYFGAAINEETTTTTVESHATIKNVLLYNRQFKNTEVLNLKPKQNPEENKQHNNESNGNDSTPLVENTTNTNTTPTTSATETIIGEREKEVQSSSPLPTTEDSAARGCCGGVVLYVVWCVYTVGALCVLTPPPPLQYFIFIYLCVWYK